MNRCEHGEKITKFCITEHCHHRQASGCDYCIKKYHFHLTNTQLLTENDIETLLKNLTFPADNKYKSRSLNEAVIEYFKTLRQSVNGWIEAAQNAVTERLTYPLLRKQSLLNVYQRLKNRDYRKVISKDLKALNDFEKSASLQNLKIQELTLYFGEVEWIWTMVEAADRLAKQLSKLPEIKEGEGCPQLTSHPKLTELYQSVMREKDRRESSFKKGEMLLSQTQKQSISQHPLELKETPKDIAIEPATLIMRRNSRQYVKIKQVTPKKDILKEAIQRKFSQNYSEKQKEFSKQIKSNTTNKTQKDTMQRQESVIQQIPDAKEGIIRQQTRVDQVPEMKVIPITPQATGENQQEKTKRLKRRRSSIDESFVQPKFGTKQQDRAKDIQERKKKLLENIFPKYKQSKKQGQIQEKTSETIDKKNQEKNTQHQSPSQSKNTKKLDQKIEAVFKRPNQLIIAKVQRQSLLAKSQQITAAAKLSISADQHSQEYQSQAKDSSQPNLFQALLAKGINIPELINNILPPLPPTAPRDPHDVALTKKIVKIPMNRSMSDEIQSPIFKKKRKQDKSQIEHGGFTIQLNPLDQNISEPPQNLTGALSTVQQANRQETDQQLPPQSTLSKTQTTKQNYSKEEGLIVLQLKQKNSLLLFCQALKSESNRAIELLRASLKYSPNNLSAAEYLSYLYLEGGHARECLEVCEGLLVMIEDKSQEFEVTLHLHNNKAAALNMLGRYSESIVVLQKCLRYRRKHYFYKNLADAYYQLGIPQKAAMNYDKAIRLDPGYDQAYYNLAVTQFIQEQYTSAKLNVEQALKIDQLNDNYKQLAEQIGKRLQNITN